MMQRATLPARGVASRVAARRACTGGSVPTAAASTSRVARASHGVTATLLPAAARRGDGVASGVCVAPQRRSVGLAPQLTQLARPAVPQLPAALAAPVPAALGAALLAAAAPLLLASPALAADAAAAVGTDFQSGFVSAFLLILFSEIGDKTFFIAVLLSLQQPRGTVFAGTFGALAVMTVISVALGRLLHVADEALPFHTDVPWDDYAAVALLLFFGVRTLMDASTPKGEEEQADAELAVAGMKVNGSLAVLASTFALVFAAEWGDKSFLATIALAAASDPVGVVAGAVAGHGTATALAVAGGSLLGEYVSEQVVAYTGGSLFIVFAAITAAEIVMGGR